MRLAFDKMNGIGNDFVFVEDLDATLEFSPDAVEWFCDRHFGVGADGMIFVRPASSPDADYYMHYFNADGSLAEMCGNGARCFVKYIVDRNLVPEDATSFTMETLGGLKPVTFTRDSAGKMATATIDMGVPVLSATDVPVAAPADCVDPTLGRVVDCGVETPCGEVHFSAVSMGNPHAVLWVDSVDDAPVEVVGPFLESHEYFPRRTNVEFAEVVDRETIRLRVWERGCGETLACGTGACATVVAAVLADHTDRTVTVELPGGELAIEWREDDGHVLLSGGAAFSFAGWLEIDEDANEEW